jgi:proteic killer suppression protein
LEIYFEDAKFKKICENQRQLVKEHGAVRARKLRLHLDNLRVAETLADMRHLPGRCHEITANRAGQFALDLDHPYRLIFKPHPPVPLKADGGIDWPMVTQIVIIGVEDYHQ